MSPRRNKEKFYLFGFVQNSHAAARAGSQQQCIIHNDIWRDADSKTLCNGLSSARDSVSPYCWNIHTQGTSSLTQIWSKFGLSSTEQPGQHWGLINQWRFDRWLKSFQHYRMKIFERWAQLISETVRHQCGAVCLVHHNSAARNSGLKIDLDCVRVWCGQWPAILVWPCPGLRVSGCSAKCKICEAVGDVSVCPDKKRPQPPGC